MNNLRQLIDDEIEHLEEMERDIERVILLIASTGAAVHTKVSELYLNTHRHIGRLRSLLQQGIPAVTTCVLCATEKPDVKRVPIVSKPDNLVEISLEGRFPINPQPYGWVWQYPTGRSYFNTFRSWSECEDFGKTQTYGHPSPLFHGEGLEK